MRGSRRVIIPTWLFILAVSSMAVTAQDLKLRFSTYVGGTGWEHARDVAVDGEQNIYVAGGTDSADFPTTPGAYQEAFGGRLDIFVMKFSPSGELIWSTLAGGSDYDRAYAVEVDDQGFVYVGGRGGEFALIKGTNGQPGAGANVYQPLFKGDWASGYHSFQNAYILTRRSRNQTGSGYAGSD